MSFVNGTTTGDPLGEFTFSNHNDSSVVDLCIANQAVLNSISDFKVLSSHISTHLPVFVQIGRKEPLIPIKEANDAKYPRITWDPNKMSVFILQQKGGRA